VDLAASAETIVLCVKPHDAVNALRDLGPALKGKLIISIVAGLATKVLEEAAGGAARVIRVMPNTPALVGQGAAAYALGSAATEADAELVEKLFRSVGIIVRVREPLLDAVTGLSWQRARVRLYGHRGAR
jgi:pyrroline-5-carboxylate reductase